MIDCTTKNFMQINNFPSSTIKFFDINTNDSKKCVVLLTRTKTEVKLFFVAYSNQAKNKNLKSEKKLLDIRCKALANHCHLEENDDNIVFIYSRKFMQNIAYRKREENIEKVINDGIRIAFSHLQKLSN